MCGVMVGVDGYIHSLGFWGCALLFHILQEKDLFDY